MEVAVNVEIVHCYIPRESNELSITYREKKWRKEGEGKKTQEKDTLTAQDKSKALPLG